MTQAPKIGLVSLGCPKALVDSERIMTTLRAAGLCVLARLCRRRHRAGQHLRLPRQRQGGEPRGDRRGDRRERPRHRHRLPRRRGRADPRRPIRACSPSPARISTRRWSTRCTRTCRRCRTSSSTWCPKPALKLTPRHYAYMKISEGCNNRCSFCIIPQIRGDLASRPIASVLYEAERLVRGGRQGILVISQDTAAYGVDIKYAASPSIAAATSRRSSRRWPRNWASSTCGRASTTSTPTRMSTASSR